MPENAGSNVAKEEKASTRVPGECRFSIVIPVLNEQEYINPVIDHLQGQAGSDACEIIVVDGDPQGGTLGVIQDKQVIAIACEKGRARQMNVGAAAARSEILIFLHADTKLPSDALKKIDQVLENRQYVAGAFDLGIESDRLVLRYIAARARFRSRLNRIPYGDQAMFIRKSYFDRIGRFKEIPIMEDIELMRRIKKKGDKIFILPDRVKTSARRWEREGALYTTLKNQVLLSLYYLGVSPQRLAKFYRSHSDDTSS